MPNPEDKKASPIFSNMLAMLTPAASSVQQAMALAAADYATPGKLPAPTYTPASAYSLEEHLAGPGPAQAMQSRMQTTVPAFASLQSVPPPPTGKTKQLASTGSKRPSGRAQNFSSMMQIFGNQGHQQSLNQIEMLRQAVEKTKQQQISAAMPLMQYGQTLAQYRPEVQQDLSALASLVDAWSGSNLAQAYQAPQQPQVLDQAAQMQMKAKGLIAAAQEQSQSGLANVAQLQMAARKQHMAANFENRRLRILEESNRIKSLAQGGKAENAAKLRAAFLKTEESENIQNMIKLKNAVNKYSKLVSKKGITYTGKNRAVLDAAYTDLKIKYKEAAKLGALTGPDIEVLEDAIKPASGFRSMRGEALSGGQSGILAGLGQIQATLDSDAAVTMSVLEHAFEDDVYSGLLNNYKKQLALGPTTGRNQADAAKAELKRRGISI